MHLGDLRGHRHAFVDEALFDLIDDRTQVDGHRVVVDLHRTAAAAREGLLDGRVDATVGLGPDPLEGLGGDDVLRLVVDEAADGVLEGVAELAERLLQERPVGGCHVLQQGRQVDVLHHRVGDPVRRRRLDVRV